MAFEQLVAEAAAKKESRKKGKDRRGAESNTGASSNVHDVAGDAPNVPRAK
jgi:hypothetical protein